MIIKIKCGPTMFKGGQNKHRCNCSFKATMEDMCMAENLVYLGKTEVEIGNSSNENLYIGTLKMNGKLDISICRDTSKYKKATSLSAFYWKIKRKLSRSPKFNWKILRQSGRRL